MCDSSGIRHHDGSTELIPQKSLFMTLRQVMSIRVAFIAFLRWESSVPKRRKLTLGSIAMKGTVGSHGLLI